ncbi:MULTISPECIES: LysR family transcriptional regulator [Kribbella]|jgi:DNA-binding transcriptional LysR family regulator|uniref:DNA-binding transcriptional LysR family regulator n=1 Tax=Kribbella pratensis TaxID=2512112 RepID=A0ABY2FGJ0_9ACTN|nr:MULTISPECIES: LysR family transcriptional regulator [Kribbella]TDW90235.1 DNA-binding transcriptional LysR family regulator [Kribbella pratensis]TDW97956.1 DNA-binding transcriptional LysR family regulator [Kribbella sp. VKM Ac-2566]
MHVEDLRWFVVLAETEHLTEAAAALGTSQPNLSRSLQRVERAFGVPLFERERRGVRLNPYGRLVLDAARAGTAAVDTAKRRIDALLDPESGTVRLAFLHSVATSLMPDLLKAFRAVAPNIGFALRQEPAHDIVQDLESGEAEIAIIAPRPDPARFGWHLLERQRLYLHVPPGHALASRRRVELESARDEAFVGLQPGFGFRRVTDRLCEEAGFSPRLAFEATDLATIDSLVGAGLGVAILPAGAVRGNDSGAVSVPLAGVRARREIGMAWRLSMPLTPAAERFRTFVRSRPVTTS